MDILLEVYISLTSSTFNRTPRRQTFLRILGDKTDIYILEFQLPQKYQCHAAMQKDLV
jgi:hypothetical protein